MDLFGGKGKTKRKTQNEEGNGSKINDGVEELITWGNSKLANKVKGDWKPVTGMTLERYKYQIWI